MKKTFKKVLSVMLVVIIFATSLPFNALAKDDTTQNNQNISTDMGDMSFTATNSFGEMLTDSLSEYTGEQNGEYYISDIEYEGYCALVTFATQQGCTIMVAAYEEDTGRMITSASVDVFAEDTEAFVEFEDELPDYFVLKAFMLDDNAAPLCKAYTCNEMTKVYEDFAATTIDDYDEDKVINLDEDETTNFLVMSDETSTITNDGRTNVLVSYDEETGVYTFGNIDEQITSLKKDDIFYFDNGNVEELTFIKVGAVDIDGTTAYITEAEASLEEVFDVVKIDNEMTSGEFALNEDEELEEGVTYLGCEEVEEPQDEVSTFGWGDETSVTFNHVFKIEKDIVPETTVKIKKVGLSGSIKFTGTVGVTVVGTFKFYISDKFSEIEFTLTPSVGLNVKIEGVGRLEIKLKSFDISPCAGVFVGITPKIVAEITGTVSFDARLKFTLGIGYNSDDGLVNKSEKPNFKPEIKVEGEIFIGVDLAPYVSVVSKKLVQLQLGTEIGAKLTSTMSSIQDEAHLCEECLDGRIDLVGEITGKFILGEDTKFEKELSVNFVNLRIKIADFYYSFTMDDFGWLDYCPNSLVVRGKCGKNLEWAYNHQTETLTITGKGKMFDYENDNVPWFDYRFDGIKKIVIGNSVTTIGEYAFYFCGELTAVEIGKGLTEIGDNAFGDCDNLTDVYYSGTQDEWDEIEIGINNDGLNNVRFHFDWMPKVYSGTCGDNITWSFDEATGILVIDGTGPMNDYLYYYFGTNHRDRPWDNFCPSVKKIVINNGVTSIGKYAFGYFRNLDNITIPDSVTTIGDEAFYECNAIENIKIPESVLAIGSDAFRGCDSLTEIVIPASVSSISLPIFYECGNIKKITVDRNNQHYLSDEEGVLFNKDKTTLIRYPAANEKENYKIPESVTSISTLAFSFCGGLKNIIMPNSVTNIGGGVFYHARSLESVILSNQIEHLAPHSYHLTGDYHGFFAGCSNLQKVEIPDSVTIIDERTFSGCSNLKNIVIPNSVTTIGEYAFSFCDRLTSIKIGSGVTSIGKYAFSGCKSLESIKIGSGVTSIGGYAFEDCGNIKQVIIDDISAWCQISFGGYYSSNPLEFGAKLVLNDTVVTSLVIPDNATRIGRRAFANYDSLTSVKIGDNVTYIGDYAFSECTNITDVEIGDNVTSIGYAAFSGCEKLTNVKIGNGVTSIGTSAFSGCDSINEISIPDSVTSLGGYVFSGTGYYNNEDNWENNMLYIDSCLIGCKSVSDETPIKIKNGTRVIASNVFSGYTKLSGVIIPDGVITIGESVFYNCKNLTSVSIPESVKSIGESAFEDCSKLTDVYYSGTEEQWNEITIDSYNYELTGATIHYNSTGATYSLRSNLSNVMSFAMTNTSDLTVYNATASNAILGNEYVIVVLNDTADINDFTNNELLYIDQKTAEADGDITFNYVPKTDDDCIVYIIGIFSDTNSVKQELITPTNPNEPENPDYNFNFYIQQPSRTKIRNMDGIYLYAVIDGVAPEGSYIEWERSNMNFITGDEGDGVYFVTADDKGYTTFTAILYDADGNELARDNVELYSKSGFFDKIGGFFRMLFGATKTYYN